MRRRSVLAVTAVVMALAGMTITRARRLGAPPTILSSVATTRRVVALTFDDGPSPYTPQILAVLRASHIRATFFVIGEQVQEFASFIRAEVAGGNDVGDHTYTHPDLLLLSRAAVVDQLKRTQRVVHAVARVTPKWFRPPYEAVDARVVRVAAALGMHTVTWTVDPGDWARPGVKLIVARVLAQVRPGSVILMHDGGGDRSQTVAALRIILRTLLARGYRFETLDELFGLGVAHHCDKARAARRFSADGVPLDTRYPIFRAWQTRFCSGEDFGPATSPQYYPLPGLTAQDFARTARRIEWNERTHAVRVQIMWSWAASVFDAYGIAPAYGTTITHAWFADYFRGNDHGPAMTEQRMQGARATQCFARAFAFEAHGRVHWKRVR